MLLFYNFMYIPCLAQRTRFCENLTWYCFYWVKLLSSYCLKRYIATILQVYLYRMHGTRTRLYEKLTWHCFYWVKLFILIQRTMSLSQVDAFWLVLCRLKFIFNPQDWANLFWTAKGLNAISIDTFRLPKSSYVI